MSALYRVVFHLTRHVTTENIKKVLTNGESIGCIYYHDENFPPETKRLNVEDAIKKIFDNLHEDKPASITTQFADTFFDILFRSTNEGKLKITLIPICSIWKIDDEDGFSKIDFARYLNIVSGLCKNCVIESIKVDIS